MKLTEYGEDTNGQDFSQLPNATRNTCKRRLVEDIGRILTIEPRSASRETPSNDSENYVLGHMGSNERHQKLNEQRWVCES